MLPQSLVCCCSPDKEAASVYVARLLLRPDHPVAALICKAFWPLRYRADMIAVMMLERPGKSLWMVMFPVAFNGDQGSTKTWGDHGLDTGCGDDAMVCGN